MTKHTSGKWRLVTDAQGPCMVMHPTLPGVAIATLTDIFKPENGFHDPVDDKSSPCPGAYDGVTYHSERVANACLIAAAPETAAERDHLREVNLALVAALEAIVERADEPCSSIARAALERAKKGG